jgi:hypothetical protein
MAELKLAEIMAEIDDYLTEKTPASLKMAIIEVHKTLDALLSSKGYPGRSIEKKLFWAGFSLKGKDDFLAALEMHKVVTQKLEFQLSDFEAHETVQAYKKVIKVIAEREKLGLADRAKNIFDIYLSPTSLIFWRNIGIFFGFFAVIKFFDAYHPAQNLLIKLTDIANFIISWQFFLITVILIGIIYFAFNYFANKSKVRIKDDVKIKEFENHQD